MGEISTKPYLIRALHEWCTDNGYTPYIVVQVDEHTMVPRGHVQEGQITLNVGTLATNNLLLGNEFIEFQARFGGVTENVLVHIGAVSAIYARETSAGMGFEVQPYEGSDEAGAVSGTEDGNAAVAPSATSLASVEGGTDDDSSNEEKTTGSESDVENKRPHLTIVK